MSVLPIPFILHWIGWDDWKTSILCAILFWLIEQTIIICNKLNNNSARQKETLSVLQKKTEIDSVTADIANNLFNLYLDKDKENDIFVNFYMNQLKSLLDKTEKSCKTGKFEIDYNMNKENYAQISNSIFRVFEEKTIFISFLNVIKIA